MSDAPSPRDASDIATLTAELVSSYLTNNQVAVSDLPGLIQSVHHALSTSNEPAEKKVDAPFAATAAQIRKSVTAAAIISFEDGKPYKTLKRHLNKRGLSVTEYKAKWGLPADYPVTSSDYSAHRSELAKTLGLGVKSKAEAEVQPKSPTKAAKSKKAAAK